MSAWNKEAPSPSHERCVETLSCAENISVPGCVLSMISVPSVVRWSRQCCIRSAGIPGRRWRLREQRFPSLPENTQQCFRKVDHREARWPYTTVIKRMTTPTLYSFSLNFPIRPWNCLHGDNRPSPVFTFLEGMSYAADSFVSHHKVIFHDGLWWLMYFNLLDQNKPATDAWTVAILKMRAWKQ